MPRTRLLLELASAVIVATTGTAAAQFGANYNRPPIEYGQTAKHDPVARLRARIDAGEVQLARNAKNGYLTALLEALDVPHSTQGLVFSKTSFQNQLIGPHNPRAIYFGDAVYVGFVPGGKVLEITAMDPDLGPIFYALEQREKGRPRIVRQMGECLSCHGASRTANWPGNIVRSVYPAADGQPITKVGSFVTTQDSPFEQRWGGWYVTGTHGTMRHMGNVTVAVSGSEIEGGDEGGGKIELDKDAGANITTLGDRFAVGRYLSPHSDIAALMVLEHQTHMHNLLARANYRVRSALHLQAATNRMMGRPADYVGDSTRRRIKHEVNEILEHLLFKNEVRLPGAVRGTSTFAKDFQDRGPRDAGGRTLRELDLQTRLFRYPCSYVIYSPSFDSLPQPVLDGVYRRMWRVLTGRFGRGYWGLSRRTRQAILEILLATKNGLPETWKKVAVR